MKQILAIHGFLSLFIWIVELWCVFCIKYCQTSRKNI